jgi:hypothetical protein
MRELRRLALTAALQLSKVSQSFPLLNPSPTDKAAKISGFSNLMGWPNGDYIHGFSVSWSMPNTTGCCFPINANARPSPLHRFQDDGYSTFNAEILGTS